MVFDAVHLHYIGVYNATACIRILAQNLLNYNESVTESLLAALHYF